MIFCTDCHSVLTDEEVKYYEVRCEHCEQLDLVRHQAWLAGKPDIELDRMYGDVCQPFH